jgi:hypothetical protein
MSLSSSAFGILTPKDSLSFGKYRGKELRIVVLEDPSYILWCALNTKTVFSKPLLEEAVNRIGATTAAKLKRAGRNIYGYAYDDADAGEVDDEYEHDMYDIFHDPDMGDR